MKPIIQILLPRWLMAPLLIMLLGDYLEGSPTRLVVRSGLFIFCSFGLSFLANNALRIKGFKAVSLAVIQTTFIPAGFIWVAQQYYNGGQNDNFSLLMFVFTGLITINVFIFLQSLFAIQEPTP